MSQPEFLLVVNASKSAAFDAHAFSSAFPHALPLVYVSVDLDGNGEADVLRLFNPAGGLRPKKTFVYVDEAADPAAASQIATKLGIPGDAPIGRPGSNQELAAMVDSASAMSVWGAIGSLPLGFGTRGPTVAHQFPPNTSGFFNGDGTPKPDPSPNPYTYDQCRYGAYELKNMNNSQMGNLLVIPQTYAPPLASGLQIGTDNFWIPTTLPDDFLLKAVAGLAAPGGSLVRRTYNAVSFSSPPPFTPPTGSTIVRRADFVSNKDEVVPEASPHAYLVTDPSPAAWRWYAPPSMLSGGLFEFPYSKFMRLTRTSNTVFTSATVAGMQSSTTPHVP